LPEKKGCDFSVLISPAYIFDLIAGMALIAGIAVMFYFVGRKSRREKKYDERQSLARLKAYRAAFWTFVVLLAINAFVESTGDGYRWGDAIIEPFLFICAAITVFVVICIFEDAYFALNEKRSFYLWMFGIIAFANSFIFLGNIGNYNCAYIENGRVTFRAMNPVVLVMFAILFASLAIKALISRGKERERSRDEEGAS